MCFLYSMLCVALISAFKINLQPLSLHTHQESQHIRVSKKCQNGNPCHISAKWDSLLSGTQVVSCQLRKEAGQVLCWSQSITNKTRSYNKLCSDLILDTRHEHEFLTEFPKGSSIHLHNSYTYTSPSHAPALWTQVNTHQVVVQVTFAMKTKRK